LFVLGKAATVKPSLVAAAAGELQRSLAFSNNLQPFLDLLRHPFGARTVEPAKGGTAAVGVVGAEIARSLNTEFEY